MSVSGFQHDHQVVRWAANQLPNLPHIQADLRRIADELEEGGKEVVEEVEEEVSKPEDVKL